MTESIPLSQVTAVMCNYARPKSARLVVKRLRDLGLMEIIVWNNGAKPIPGATRNLRSEKNIRALGRYYAALDASKPYILMVDDDVLLTKKGLHTLLKFAPRYPAVVQAGLIFGSPFKKNYRRTKYLSDKVKTIKKIDVVISNRGMILKKELCRPILDHWVWGSLKAVRKGFITTDIPVSCAILDLTGRHSVVVPVNGCGYRYLPDEAPQKASRNQKNYTEERTKMLKWLVNKGWQLLGDSGKPAKQNI
jgi:hypothetical protein